MKKPEEYADETMTPVGRAEITALIARVQRDTVEACCAIHDGRFCRMSDHMQQICECEQSIAAMKALLEGK